MQVESPDVVCVLREARDYIFLRAPGASYTHEQQGSGGRAGCAARGELLPGSRGQVPGQCPADSVPAVMDEVLWVIHAPRSLGGASGGGFGSKPRLT